MAKHLFKFFLEKTNWKCFIVIESFLWSHHKNIHRTPQIGELITMGIQNFTLKTSHYPSKSLITTALLAVAQVRG